MRLIAVTAVVWIAIAIVWWLTVGAEVAKAQKPFDWSKVAAFYAGRPITMGTDPRGPLGATTGAPMSGEIRLGSGLQKGLADFLKHLPAAKKGNKDAMQNAAVLGANALSILIHEAIHNREFSAPDPSNPFFTPYLESNQRGPYGFYGAGNEPQAQALGAELVPDMLQRFFGVKIGSPLSNRIAKAAKNRGEYQGAYRVGAANG